MTKQSEIGTLILRLVIGITFLIHGLDKFQSGIGNIAGWFESIGLPGFLAYIVATIETVGGIAVILGLGTRIVSFLFILVLAGAIITVKSAVGFTGNGQMAGYELDLALLAIAVHLAINGSSLYSVDALLRKK
ncbi:oxidoreductase [Aneurinibacillus migulanus]|uniref:Oxidoreductase n=1 Tax=Aneurinibacillus migulanus TaxID=47500 RepID=A0A0D1VGS3_ANEMI|nr:DoxX family protein [Aneurinibacillus migulanus]KIV53705.1 oxidoreductase [Aneurinibacillus migulanus]KIV58659.1 oxidoreductase [Aneurinibacillus migulanus]KON96345.1 oxidoreductase [Aneurinibacillus migulanus]KPD08941.1 oxidoreductase [Aneurinibacillus migulanus]MCP1357723.1 DoxX family protein [Aneurinibacillus migulanus]